MNNEINIVSRDETFNDIAVRNLAKAYAKALCAIQFGRITEVEYKQTSEYKKYITCYNSLSYYDQIRVDDWVHEYYKQFSLYPEQYMSHSQYKKHMAVFYFGLVCMVILVVLLPLLATACSTTKPTQKPFFESDNDYFDAIVRIIEYTRLHVYDCNKDGVVNCRDYAELFKKYWDMLYYHARQRCIIIRNYNPDKLNHLFNGIILDDGCLVCIEPDPYRVDEFLMEMVWGTNYDPAYNVYTETDKWLKEIKQ